MLRVTDIQWTRATEDNSERRCPICGTYGQHKIQLDIPHMRTGSRVNLYQCGSCNTRFYPNAVESSYDDGNIASETFLQHYLEAGAGPWEMFWPIARFYNPSRTRLLDVGCGFGISLDMWSTIFSAEATGVEAAEWGQIGSSQLGIPIHRGMLDEIPALQGKTFDIVYASEVIEHVADPRAFLASLSGRISEKGVLVLTTPSGEFIEEGNDEKDILAALLPGDHLFLLSAKALELLLYDTGFQYVQTVSARERLFAYASNSPLDLTWPEQNLRQRYVEYLRTRLRKATPGKPFHDGFAFRLFKELTAKGELSEARQVDKQLCKSMALRFGIDQSQNAWIGRAESVANIDHWGKELPFFIGSYCFLRGELCRISNGDISDALDWFNASLQITLRSIKISPLFFTEAVHLMWVAMIRSILLNLSRGSLGEALNIFEFLSDARAGRKSIFHGVKPELVSVLEVVPRLLPELLTTNDNSNLGRFNIEIKQALATTNNDKQSSKILQLLVKLIDLILYYRQGNASSIGANGNSLTNLLSSLTDTITEITGVNHPQPRTDFTLLKSIIVRELYSLGVSRQQEGKPREAEHLYKNVLLLDELHGDAVTNLSIIHLARGEPEEAFKLVELSLEINPDQPDVLNTYGSMLHDRSRLDDALASFDHAISLNPDYSEAYNNRGIVLFNLKRLKEALASFETAISLKPDYEEAHANKNTVLQILAGMDRGEQH